MAKRRRGSDPFGPAVDAARLAAEIPAVIALRLAKLSLGGPAAATEAALMVNEKLHAAATAGLMAAAAFGRGQADGDAAAILRLYRRKVAANRRRLGRGT
jgi:hypothetical protein